MLNTITAFLIGLVALSALVIVLSMPLAAIVTVLLGIAHSFNEIVPALGFMETWMLTMVVLLLKAHGKSSN